MRLPGIVFVSVIGTAAALCVSCGASQPGPGSAPAGPTPAAPIITTAPAGHDADSPSPDAHAPGQSPVTQAECEALLDRFLALARTAHAATVAAELVPTDEQLAEIRAKLAPTYIPACMNLTRAAYQCERAAASIDEQVECSMATSPR